MAPLIQGHAGWCGYKQTPRRHSFTVGLSGSLQFIRPFILTALLSCQQSCERHISITLLSHQRKQKLIRVTDLLKDWHPGQGYLWTPNPMPTTLWHDGSQWSLPARLFSAQPGGRKAAKQCADSCQGQLSSVSWQQGLLARWACSSSSSSRA